MNLPQVRKKINTLLERYRHAKRQVREEKEVLERAEKRVAQCEEAQGIVQRVAQAIQIEAHKKIAGIASRCLEATFEGRYELQIKFERKRGKTEAKLMFLEDGNEIEEGEATSGGVLDVAAFALRVARIVMSRPKRRFLIILDEPFKHMAVENQAKMGALIKSLAKDLGMQFIIATHSQYLKVGKIINLERNSAKE